MRDRLSSRSAVLLCLLLWSMLAAALPPPDAPPQHLTTVEGISEYRLDNGLRVLLFPDQSKPTVTVNLTYLVGSRHEHYGETGMAHLLEHLLFKGTPTHGDIPGEMRRRGIGFNATTWLDRTNYFASFNADDDTLDWLLGLEADRMLHALIRREDLDSEMTVVRNEMERGENSPLRVLMDRIASTAYLWHNYGNSTIGARSDVENMPIERLQAFYRRHYRPDNATLLIAGRIDPVRTLTRVAATFGPIPRPDGAPEATYTREPAQDGEREVNVRRVGESRYVGVSYHVPAGRHPDFAALTVLANVLGDTPTGRLHKALVETGLATSAGSVNHALAEPGFMMFLAEAPRGDDADDATQRLEAALLAQLEGLAAQPVTAAEVADAQRRFERAFEQTIHDANRLAMALSEAIAQGDWRLFFLQRDRLAEVDADAVNRVAAAYMRRSNRTLGRFIPTAHPERAVIEEAPSAAELVAEYRGREAVAAGEAFDPQPAVIDARTRDHVLANGTRVRLLPISTRGNTVAFNLSFRFGDEAAVMGLSRTGSMAAAMLSRGSTERSRDDIARRLDELSAQLGFSGGAQSLSARGNTRREHLPALVSLMAELMQQPAFPESEFEQLRAQAITSIERARAEPETVAGQAMSRHFSPWPPGHPYHAPDFDAQIAELRAVTVADLRDFHQRFHGAGDGEIAVVGDFDADALLVQLDALFGGWNRGIAFERIADPLPPLDSVRQALITPDKANAVLYARADFAMDDRHPDYPALVAANQVFGGGGMKAWLADRIREREGLSYTVASSLSANPQDERASLMVYAIAAPQNIERVEAAFREEFARLLADGVGADELRDAIVSLLQGRERGRAEHAVLAAQLRGNAYLGRTMEWTAQFEQRLRELDADTVNAAVRRHFGALEFSVFTAGDFR